MKPPKKYSGVVIPAVTPLTADHKLDTAAVEKIFNGFRSSGVQPFVLGTTGEAASLPFSLKKEFLAVAGRLKQSGDVLYAGISANVLAESVVLAQCAFDNGADAAVATLPSYYALTDAGMLRYFSELADAVPGPLMIYNIPATTHMSVPLDVVEQLSRHHNLVGLKDSERNADRMTEAIERWQGRDDFSYFLGWAAKSADAVLTGGDGLVPSTGNFHPALYRDLFAAAQTGDKGRALNLQSLSDALGNLYQQGRTLGESLWALKVLMNEIGLCGTQVMPPLYAQGHDEEQRLRSAFQQLLNAEEINLQTA